MEIYNQTTFESTLDPNIVLDGEYVIDDTNALGNGKSLRMYTNPNAAPYYFYYWRHNLPLLTGTVRLDVLAAMNENMRSFGIGWRIYKNNQLAIMFARINYGNNTIEVVKGTAAPHIWETVTTPIPLDLRSDSPLKPFRFVLDVNIDTFTYERVRLRSGSENDHIYNLSIANTPMDYEYPDGMSTKINPQGSNGIVGATWMDNVTVYN